MDMILAAIGPAWPVLVALLGAIVGFGTYAVGKRKGVNETKTEQALEEATQTRKTFEEVRDVKTEIDSLDPGGVNAELVDNWVQKPPKPRP